MANQMSAYERTLNNWAKETRASFSPEVRKAINLASYDLHFGPPCGSDCADLPTDEHGNENEWSGFSFEKACETIKEALEDIPSVMYIDIPAECWQTEEPKNDVCSVCEGGGLLANDAGDTIKCYNCNGEGVLEPLWDEVYRVEKSDLIKAIVGKELANYV